MSAAPGASPRSARRAVWAWALYDWANSAFATTVVAGFFPLFFKDYWNSGVSAADSTLRLGNANAIASLVILVAGPVLGAIADRSHGRKRLLAVFAALGILATAALAWVAHGQWLTAAALFVLASVGFSGSLIFYDALLPDVAGEGGLDRVSALGYALGYLGGGLLFAINVAMVAKPSLFGLADKALAVKLAFVSVAVWWAVFSVPLFASVPARHAGPALPWLDACGAGLRQLVSTARQLRRLRMIALFLLAYWLYIDGVSTIYRMAVDYGLSLGLNATGLMTALLVTQFVSFPAALGFGRLAGLIGARRAIYAALWVYGGVVCWGYFLHSVSQFYLMAIGIGLVQGGLQSLSRSYFARMVPPGQSAEFFGFYNMLGKFAAVLGPALVGWTAVLTGSPRLSILSILVLFAAGGVLLWRVDDQQGRREAQALAASSGQPPPQSV